MYEAAEIDGANVFGRFRHITIPGLANVIVITAMLSTIWTATSINFIYVLTNGGGPARHHDLPHARLPDRRRRRKRLGSRRHISLIFFPIFVVMIYFLTKRMLASER
jgi:ABC-type sugar transport system permease subunit